MDKKNKCKQCYKQVLGIKGFMHVCSQECKDALNETIKCRRKTQKRNGQLSHREERKIYDRVFTNKELIFENYKEPLATVKDGHGYYGCVARTKDKNFVQCHICGKVYKSLSGHVRLIHKMNLVDYKKKFKLSPSTPLIGDKTKQLLIKAYEKDKKKHLDPWNKLTIKQKQHIRKKMNNYHKKRRGLSVVSLEVRNKRGSCPDQLLDKIKKLKEKLNKSPSFLDFRREYGNTFGQAIYRTFSSWNKACELAGFTCLQDEMKEKYKPEKLLEYLKIFYKKYKRTPRYSDLRDHVVPSAHPYIDTFGSLNRARYEAEIPVMVRGLNGKYIETMDYDKYMDQLNFS